MYIAVFFLQGVTGYPDPILQNRLEDSC
jgi:hypothetical protein